MKKYVSFSQLMLFVCSIYLIIFITNCSQTTKYSCDDEINKWVTNNLKDLQSITRTKLAEYPFNYQVAIYRSLSADKKAEIWSEKMDSIEYYNWPQNFHPYFDSLKNKIDADFFDYENLASSRTYCSSMLGYILSIQGIDTNQVVSSFFTIMTISEIEQGVYEAEPGAPNCVCNWSLTCSMLNAGVCEEGLNNCSETEDGCGFWYLYSCKGDCTEMVVDPNYEE